MLSWCARPRGVGVVFRLYSRAECSGERPATQYYETGSEETYGRYVQSERNSQEKIHTVGDRYGKNYPRKKVTKAHFETRV